jgi:hypothetical protein
MVAAIYLLKPRKNKLYYNFIQNYSIILYELYLNLNQNLFSILKFLKFIQLSIIITILLSILDNIKLRPESEFKNSKSFGKCLKFNKFLILK